MTHSKPVKPTQAELEILRILWDNREATVRKVHEKLEKEKETGYTTTLKIMQNMYEKGFVERKANGRSHIYFATLKEDEVQKKLLGGFLNIAFGGSAKKLVMQALGNHKTSKEEIREIRKMLDDLEKSEKN